jgi:hypothetical protein
VKRHDAVGVHNLSQAARPAAASLSPNGTMSVVIGRNIAPQSAIGGNTRHRCCIIERQHYLSTRLSRLDVFDAKSLKDLEDENAKLNKRAMVAIAIVRWP